MSSLLRNLAALLAISSVSASPVIPRQPKEVDVFQVVTVVEHVTVVASDLPTTIEAHEAAVVTEPVIVVVTATVRQTLTASPSTTPVAVPTSSSPAPHPQAITETVVEQHTEVIQATSQPAAATTSIAAAASTSASPTQDNLPTDTIIFDLHPTDATYKKLALFSHNVHRQNHTDTPNLTYNSTLVAFAKEKAEGCQWNEILPDDASAAGVGMNQAEGTYIGAANITTIISDMWYNWEFPIFPGFGQANPNMTEFDLWGHFTQVLWKDTKDVGCWSAACDRHDDASHPIGSGFYTVCMYWPPANFPGQYAEQIGAPLGHSLVAGV